MILRLIDLNPPTEHALMRLTEIDPETAESVFDAIDLGLFFASENDDMQLAAYIERLIARAEGAQS